MLRCGPPETTSPSQGALDAVAAEEKQGAGFTLAGDARVELPDGRAVDIAAVPDRAPTIALPASHATTRAER